MESSDQKESAVVGRLHEMWQDHMSVATAMEMLLPQIAQMSETIIQCCEAGGKVLFCGNGGSAADAQHLAAEFVIRFRRERRALGAIALTVDTSILTAGGNDYGFERIFARQVEALGRPGDVLVGFSTSGKSPNVVAALAMARDLGLATIGFTGGDGGVLPSVCDECLVVPSHVTARIQECHILAGHMICELVDEHFSEAL